MNVMCYPLKALVHNMESESFTCFQQCTLLTFTSSWKSAHMTALRFVYWKNSDVGRVLLV